MYEYGARNYDPAVGRFFNIDNYAEKFLDMTPYQYAGNTPTYFIDENGEYIYVYDKGIKYKFDNGKLFGRDNEGNWAEHTPEAGSFLETVFEQLTLMYEFSTGGGGTGGGGNSFGKSLLNMFNNENYNVHIENSNDLPASHSKKGETFHTPVSRNGVTKSKIYLNVIGDFSAMLEYAGFSQYDLMFVIGHELGHSLSYLYGVSIRENTWLTTPDKQNVRVDEIFGIFIENQLRSQFNQPLRINNFNWGEHPQETMRQGSIIPINGQLLGTDINTILNDYKKSIPLKW